MKAVANTVNCRESKKTKISCYDYLPSFLFYQQPSGMLIGMLPHPKIKEKSVNSFLKNGVTFPALRDCLSTSSQEIKLQSSEVQPTRLTSEEVNTIFVMQQFKFHNQLLQEA